MVAPAFFAWWHLVRAARSSLTGHSVPPRYGGRGMVARPMLYFTHAQLLRHHPFGAQRCMFVCIIVCEAAESVYVM